ncbi:thioredoxin domain-containing protein, partial [Clavibacter michiganensis subsp. michiganensis]|nr:thioredoxin domain-containing protein [Clavibacter michiganensis subsp. michiganensis]
WREAGGRQLVVVLPDQAEAASDPLAAIAHALIRPPHVSLVVTETAAGAWAAAGFELLADRVAGSTATAYLCADFVCRLPVTTADALRAQLDDAA